VSERGVKPQTGPCGAKESFMPASQHEGFRLYETVWKQAKKTQRE